jgi:hypothetical protein
MQKIKNLIIGFDYSKLVMKLIITLDKAESINFKLLYEN